MSNLASRSHEWEEWEIEELLLELPVSAKSKGKRRPHFRILLRVRWLSLGAHTYMLTAKSSPSGILLERKTLTKNAIQGARILARKVKDSKGRYAGKSEANLDKFLTSSLT